MAALLLGALALVFILAMAYAYTRVSPPALARAMRYSGVVLLGLIALGLVAAERFAIATFVGTLTWTLFTSGRLWPGGWPHYGFPGGTRGGQRRPSSSGQTSRVRTGWIEMELDHDSGDMEGRVLKGRYEGATLASLDRAAVTSLLNDAGGDTETVRLLETYLDRRFGPDWRTAEQDRTRKPSPASSGMSRAEALRVLGLEDGADEAMIRAAHRRLMLQNHPDRGGSSYLAAKINEAKDVLLGD